MEHEFKICRALVAALAIDTLLLIALLACGFVFKGSLLQIIIPGFFAAALAFVSWEMGRRRIGVGADGFCIVKFFRKRVIPWEDITELDALVVRKRVHFLLTTKRGFYFFSNAYRDAYGCVKMIRERLDEERVTPNIDNLLKYPLQNRGDLVAAIIAGIAIALIIYMRYF